MVWMVVVVVVVVVVMVDVVACLFAGGVARRVACLYCQSSLTGHTIQSHHHHHHHHYHHHHHHHHCTASPINQTIPALRTSCVCMCCVLVCVQIRQRRNRTLAAPRRASGIELQDQRAGGASADNGAALCAHHISGEQRPGGH
jgi:hypothetical protein